MSIDTNNSVSTKADIDWSTAPEGATHAEPKGYLMFYKQEDKEWMYFSDSDGAWCQSLEKIVLVDGDWCFAKNKSTKLFPRSKPLTQAVFDGLPPEYRWAYLDRDGDPCVISDFEAELDARFPDHQPDCYEDGLELATWMDSVLWRKESIHDVARSIEAARVAERTYPHYFKDVSAVDQIDVYAVLRLFEVTDPALFHAFKKIACAGKRGAKDQAQDVQEAIDALKRWQELNK
mgnify:CR=1 FL=1